MRPLYRVAKMGMLGNMPIRGLFRKSSTGSWAKETIKKMTLPAIAVLAWTDVGLWSIFTYLYYHDKVSHLVRYLSDNANNQSSSEETKGGVLAKYFDLQTDTKLVEGIAFGCIARKLLFPLPFKFAVSMFMGGVFTYSKLLYMIIMVPLWATFVYILLLFINYES